MSGLAIIIVLCSALASIIGGTLALRLCGEGAALGVLVWGFA